ncbi:helicase-associated domain-containing protein [Paenibacillus gansuensis]|uniref:Helicase-associated domain-containing protein n=1 Tax=Paenibacillus gansuensis TaxID=306542 RepID=A0ABW5PD21_9BACL
MDSAQLINRLPAELKNHLAAVTGAGESSDGSRLAETLSDQEWIYKSYRSLSDRERSALAFIMLAAGSAPFEWQLLEQKLKTVAAAGRERNVPLSPAALKTALIQFRRKGLLFTFRKTWGEHVYTFSSDTFSLWLHAALPDMVPAHKSGVPDTEVLIIREAGRGLAQEVFQLLTFTANHGLPLTQKGTIHKRLLQKAEEQIRIDPHIVSGLSFQYAHQDAYPPHFAVVLDRALRLGLLVHEQDRIALVPDRIAAWVKRAVPHLQASLYRGFADVYRPAEVWKQLAGAALERLTAGEWYAVRPIIKALDRLGVLDQDSIGRAEEEWAAGWLKPLAELGWADLGEHPDQGLMFRWSFQVLREAAIQDADAMPELIQTAQIFVQPDFEVIVPPTVSFAVRWELECFCDPAKFDQVMVYRLSRESVFRGLEHGRTLTELISSLEKWAKYGIPGNISSALNEWGQQYGRVSFADVVLLRCRDEQTAAELAVHPGAKAYLISSIGKQDYIVQKDKLGELYAILDKAGYHPRKRVDAPVSGEQIPGYPRLDDSIEESAEAPNAAADLRPRGIVYGKTSVPYYEMEPGLPSLDEIYPSLEEVPSLWLNGLRGYHSSTKREMLDKALELQAYVKLSDGQKTFDFVPDAVRDERGGWSAEGLADGVRSRLTPDLIKEMQLILPGINEN